MKTNKELSPLSKRNRLSDKKHQAVLSRSKTKAVRHIHFGARLFFNLFMLWLPLSSHSNPLKNDPSPYLAMHGDDPVNWHHFSNPTLSKAKQKNKLIFISSGYFACHWCHVMQKESYQNKSVANFLNQHFISIKLDRELSPAIDSSLVNFSKSVTGVGGWPQHAVLTPEGYPLSAFIYLPADDMVKQLQKLVQFWQQAPDKLSALARAYTPTSRLKQQNISLEFFKKETLMRLDNQIDELTGGFKRTQKFPPMNALNTLLDAQATRNDYVEWIEITLDQMQDNQLFDHINGGFYRYTIDPNWQIPHFEKMLYNQGLLAEIYFKAGRFFERPDWIQTGQTTLDYIERDLTHPSGLFYSSHSAVDEAGVEGGNYLFSQARLQTLLENTLSKSNLLAFLEISADWVAYDNKHHPYPTNKNWKAIQNALRTSSENQAIPIDKKALIAWNALIASAYVEGYKATNHRHLLDKAITLTQRLSTLLLQASPPKGLSAMAQPIGEADLYDYAYTIRAISGLLNTLETDATAKMHHQLSETQQRLITLTTEKFLTPSGWRETIDATLPFQMNRQHISGDPLPSPTAIMKRYTNPKSLNSQIMASPLSFIEYIHLK